MSASTEIKVPITHKNVFCLIKSLYGTVRLYVQLKSWMFSVFLKIVKSPLFQDTTKHLKKSGCSTICDVISGHWSLCCLRQSFLQLKERKRLINALFLDATTGQIRERAYPFIQDWWHWEGQRRKKWMDFIELKSAHWEPKKIFGGVFERLVLL